jgi:hypothetical protein
MFTDKFKFWGDINDFTDEFSPKCFTDDKTLNNDGIEYSRNSNGYRSDEFKTEHDGKHILFTGCSTTFGVGLYNEEVWANILYNKISKKEKYSGYFNLSFPGASIYTTILDIFKYFNKFGNPDVIFINLTDSYRFFAYDNKAGIYKRTNFDESEKLHEIDLINYNMYFMLEQYCRANNIKLFSFSYRFRGPTSTNEVFSNYGFNTYYNLNEKVSHELLFKLKQDHDGPFFEKARDNIHRGTGFHIMWSDFMFDKYLNN